MGASSSAQSNLYEILRRYSSDTPKEAEPSEPVLLAKPENYDLLFNTQGIALVKGFYGSGKTYGYGLRLYHHARMEGKFDTIYLNVREARLLKGIKARRNIIDLIDFICSSDLSGTKGVYLATSTEAVKKACSQITGEKRDPVEIFRVFLEDVAEKATRRMFIVIDELEEIGQLWGRKDKANVYHLILDSLRALRPGIIDKHPYKLTLVYLIQEALYPTQEMKDLIKREATTLPALGRIIATSSDGSIATRYNLTSYITYINDALNTLERLGIDKSIIDDVRDNLLAKGISSKVEKYLVNMPAFIAFDFIHRLIDEAVTDREGNIEVKFDRLLNSVPIYKVYGGTRGNIKPEQLVNSLTYLVKSLYPGEKIHIDRVLRLGYEGVYSIHIVEKGKKIENHINIFLMRFSDIKFSESEKYKKEFIRLYKEVLDQCTKSNTVCRVYVLHPKDVSIQPGLMALSNIYIDNNKLNIGVTSIGLTYDDVFTLLVVANEDIAVPANVRSYVEEKFRNDLLNIIQSQITTL